MRLACGDVLAVQVPVNVDRGVDHLHDPSGPDAKRPPHILLLMTPSASPMNETAPFFRRFRFMPAAFILGAMAGLAVVYGMGGFQRNAGVETACGPAADLAKKLTPLVRGEIAALPPAERRSARPRLRSVTATVATARSRTGTAAVVLLNLWATWCVPCKKEMPALDLAAKKARRTRLRSSHGQYGCPRSRQGEGVAEGSRDFPALLLCRPPRRFSRT